MAKLVYSIVEHDGGWAYKVGSTFSETFPSPGSTDGIVYEDSEGKWHEEVADGSDRPQTEVSE